MLSLATRWVDRNSSAASPRLIAAPRSAMTFALGQHRQAEDPTPARRHRPDLPEGLRGEGQRQDRPALLNTLSYIRYGDMLCVQEVDRLGRNLLEGLIVLNNLFQRGIAVKVLKRIAAGEHTERSLILDLALSEDRRRDIVRKTKDGLEAARRRNRVSGRWPVVDDDKRAAIRTIAAGVKVSIGVVHKTLTDTKDSQAAPATSRIGTASGGKPRPDTSLTPLTVPLLLAPRR
ncbi:recombinase family protein [Streptosporangium sp. NPDC050280]|uniref:recombinase family protein n=1 Tax=unclassified Streptosporangium TaxID=2632669 RepID=UPI00341E8962